MLGFQSDLEIELERWVFLLVLDKFCENLFLTYFTIEWGGGQSLLIMVL